MKRKIFTLSLLTIFAGLYAQENSSEIDEINVYGKILDIPIKNAGVNATVLSKKDIEQSSAKSIDEILQSVTGMDIRRRGANGVQSDVSIRGGNFEQVLILINGIRMNDSQTGHNSLNIPVNLADVERIEIVKGASARRFGNNAYSGVVNIVTKVTSEKKVKIFAEGGDFSTYQVGLSSQFGTEKMAHSFSASTVSSEGYRHNTDYLIRNAFYENSVKLNNGKIGLQAGISEKKFGANGFYASPLATEQYEETVASVIALTHRQKLGRVGLQSSVSWRRGQDIYVFSRQKPAIYRNMHIGNNIGGELNASYESAIGTTGLGAELRKEFLASNNLGHRERFLTQIFLEHQFSLFNQRLKITPGLTWANYSHSGNFFYPGLDAGFTISTHSSVFGNVGKVHRIPSFTDLYYISKTEQGNPNLKPENSLSYEVGYRYQRNLTTFSASYFGKDTKNAIDWTKSDAAAVWNAENIGNIQLNGLEAEISQSLANRMFTATAGYTYLDSKFNKSQLFSRYALDNLRHQLTAKLVTNIGSFSHEISYRYHERVNYGSFNVLDSRLNYRTGNLLLFASVNNLTNSKYTETFGVPMPGRWFHAGFSVEIK